MLGKHYFNFWDNVMLTFFKFLLKTIVLFVTLNIENSIGQTSIVVDNYPSKAVKIIVPFTPGGATDITARIVAEKLQFKWGQPVLVENKPGGGSNIGADYVAKSPPDGYTLVLGVTGSHGINVSLYKKMPYHPIRDFEPITQATMYQNAIHSL